MKLRKIALGIALVAAFGTGTASAETIRVAIGTQDPTINTATGGLVIRELGLLEKYLPKDGKYKDVTYDVQWKSFTSGPPLTNEMVAGKLDIGSMAEFPGLLNITAHQKAGKKSVFISVLSGSTAGSGNGIVVPIDSPVQRFSELKGKQISVPFGSSAHGVLLRAIKAQGWDPEKDVTLVSQSPEVGGSALQAHKIDAHANFVPFAELFPFRGFARKIYDGSQDGNATFHGTLVDAEYAKKYPEVVVAVLKAVLEADRLTAEKPEEISELIQKVTGVDAEVSYQFHGPLGLQTRDYTFKPEFRAAAKTALETLKFLKRTETDFDVNEYIDESFVRQAARESGLDYDARLKQYGRLPLVANDARTGKPITAFDNVAQIWVKGEPLVRHYANPQNAFADLRALEAKGRLARVVYVHDHKSGVKLFGNFAWYATDSKGTLRAFLHKSEADAWAKTGKGKVYNFAAVKAAGATLAAK